MSLKETVAKLAKKGAKTAEEILAKVGTAEEAVKLKGAERAEYLKALDEVHGPRSDRAAKMGFDTNEKLFHGSNASNIENFKAGNEGLYGAGTYLTDSPSVASSYAKPRAINAEKFKYDIWSGVPREEQLAKFNKAQQVNSPTVYPLIAKKSGAAINMDSALDAEKWSKILSPDELKSLGKDATNDSAYKLLQENMAAQGMSKAEAADAGLRSLEEMGIDTVKHKGGMRIGDEAHNVTIKNNPSDIRSENANFDPRFADSDLIMSAKQTAPKSTVDKVLSGLSYLQRKGMKAGAEALGVKGDSENSEASAQNIVENLAKRAGIPESSTAGNIAKAAGVAGLEVFGDPLQFIPAGKIAKLIGKAKNTGAVAKILEKFPQVVKLAEETPKAMEASKAVEGISDFEKLQKQANAAKVTTKAQEIARKADVIKGNATADVINTKPAIEEIMKKAKFGKGVTYRP